jgi:hypothetical protein
VDAIVFSISLEYKVVAQVQGKHKKIDLFNSLVAKQLEELIVCNS